MRADRLVSLVLLLQARGRTPASALARDLEVSVRTIYRDLAALSAAGVPVVAESGPGGGCELLDGYRFALRGLRPEEAEALLILGVPDVLADLGLDAALAAAQHQVSVTSAPRNTGLANTGLANPGLANPGLANPGLVHLDMPRWFTSEEPVPELRTVAQAVRQGRMLAFQYRDRDRVAAPLGLVNKAGTWYLVAVASTTDRADRADGADGQRASVYRVGRIDGARLLDAPVARPPGFSLGAFWAAWSAEFAASRPRMTVTVRASPEAFGVFPEVFGDAVLERADAAGQDGWRLVTLSFEHEHAAVHRLAGFGGAVEVLSPMGVRELLLVTAHDIIRRYGTLTEPGRASSPR
jgi:predicted DNA-binding transcriptional regulator YafY